MQKNMREQIIPLGQPLPKGGVDTILANIFREFMRRFNVNASKFDGLMTAWLQDSRHNVPQNLKEKSSERGNLRKELLRGIMTWKVFCKSLQFLKTRRFIIVVYAEDEYRNVHAVQQRINFVEADQYPSALDRLGDMIQSLTVTDEDLYEDYGVKNTELVDDSVDNTPSPNHNPEVSNGKQPFQPKRVISTRTIKQRV